MYEQDHFQTLRVALCAEEVSEDSLGEMDGTERLRAGSWGRMAEMRQQQLFLKSFQGLCWAWHRLVYEMGKL